MSILVMGEVKVGDTTLEGQVCALDVDGLRMSAPNGKRDWFRLDITAALGADGAPDKQDIGWLFQPGVRVLVLLSLPDGTLDTSAIPPMDTSNAPR